jgi:hypothetical protein
MYPFLVLLSSSSPLEFGAVINKTIPSNIPQTKPNHHHRHVRYANAAAPRSSFYGAFLRNIETHHAPPVPQTHHPPSTVGGNLKNRPTSPTKAEQAHDRHVSRTGLGGDPKKQGSGGKGTWGSVQDDIKDAERTH